MGKMYSPLDLTGNQIKNFLVHNGDATSDSKLPAQTGRLVYDTTNRSMYFGYQSDNGLAWSRLVDAAHLGEAMADDEVYAWAKAISGAKIEDEDGNTNVPLTAEKVVELLGIAGSIPPFAVWASTYINTIEDTCGDNDAFAKILRERAEAFVVSEIVHIANNANNPTIFNEEYDMRRSIGMMYTYTPTGVVMNKVGNELLVRMYCANNSQYYYLRKWVAFSNGVINIAKSDDYKRDGVILFVPDGNVFIRKDGAFISAVDITDLTDKVNTTYGWGNHADAGYAKAFFAYEAFEESEAPLKTNIYEDLNAAISQTGHDDWVKPRLAYSTNANKVRCEYRRMENGVQKSIYVKNWQGVGGGVPAPNVVNANGNLLFVKGNASIYKYESGSWSLYFSGVSQEVIKQIDAIREALGLDEDPTAGAEKNWIDTWNEMKHFFANIDNSEDLQSIVTRLQNGINEKANKATTLAGYGITDALAKPVVNGTAGQVLVQGSNGLPVWATHKIAVEKEYAADNAFESVWEIDITALDTLDVTVRLYEVSGLANLPVYTEVMADVTISKERNDEREISNIVRITFGEAPKGVKFRAVITA